MNTITELIGQLTAIPSPTGFTQPIINWIDTFLTSLGYSTTITNKGALKVTVLGKNNTQQRFITAHVDTLGAMVKEIKSNGRLKIEKIGGYTFNSIEGNYCTIHTMNQKEFHGTCLMHQTSVHVYVNATDEKRNQENMEIRLDEKVKSAEDVRLLGINVGDFISFDPCTIVEPNGFIKSRHLDDKVSCAILLDMLKQLKEEAITLPVTTHFYFSTNEEIGYGGNSNIPVEVVEYIAVDMGAMGDGQQTDEYTVSICAKDSSGPYHLGLRNHLVSLCQMHTIPYQIDIYPYYGSDASSAMRAGADVKHALFGAGIESSHALERTHLDSVIATKQLVLHYLLSSLASE